MHRSLILRLDKQHDYNSPIMYDNAIIPSSLYNRARDL